MCRLDRADNLCSTLCCDKKKQKCMFRECDACRDKVIAEAVPEGEEDDDVSYYQWEHKKEVRMIKGKQKEITFMHKALVHCTKRGIVMKLSQLVEPFMRHVFVKEHQQDEICTKKNGLSKNEAIIQVDYSENYVCKYAEEAQGMHFGASKVQLTLHTGVQYLVNTDTGQTCVRSFATVSSNLDHGAHAVWAHLTPVLTKLSHKHPEVDTIHFVSDGPTAQYRNRFNVFLMVSHLQKICPFVKFASWNFSESGHGKGPMDGVGGTLKRLADEHVARGNDITSVAQFVSHLSVSCPGIDLVEVKPEDIESSKLLLPKKVSAVPGVMHMHQVTWDSNDTRAAYIRSLSCFTCDFGAVCSHYRLGKGKVMFKFIDTTEQKPGGDVESFNLVNSLELQMNDLVADTDDFLGQAGDTSLNDLVALDNDVPSASTNVVDIPEVDDNSLAAQVIKEAHIPTSDKSANPDMVDINGNDVTPSLQQGLLLPTSANQLRIGIWISVVYGKKWYPGVIEEIRSSGIITVKFMQRNRNYFRWPKRSDRQNVELDDILCILAAAPVAESSAKYTISGVEDIDLLLRDTL